MSLVVVLRLHGVEEANIEGTKEQKLEQIASLILDGEFEIVSRWDEGKWELVPDEAADKIEDETQPE